MKTFRKILPVLAAVLAAGCTTRPVAPRFELFSLDTLVGSAGSGSRVEYRFATIRNAGESAALEAIEQANVNYFFQQEAFSGPAAEAAAQTLSEIAEELDIPGRDASEAVAFPGGEAYETSAESEGAVVDTLVTYVIYRSSYLGGAHGLYTTECHTYSLQDGYELSAADLFGEERLDALATAIRRKLYDRYGVDDDEGLRDAGFFPEYIGVTENFRITPEGVTFHYNPYDIGCYALGDIEVAFGREELAGPGGSAEGGR